MKKFLSSLQEPLSCILALGFFITVMAYIFRWGVEQFNDRTVVYKDFVELTIDTKGRLDLNLFETESTYVMTLKALTQEVIDELPFDEVINNTSKITQEVRKRYEMTGEKLKSLYIMVTPPKDFSFAGQRLKSMPMTIAVDSMISAAAKRDAQGYTPEAERLEERRDARYNELKRIESNERIKIRQAEAIENAADNMGFLSGDLSVSLGE